MHISLIAAIGKHRQIGKDGRMLWHIPRDFQHFKQTTLGHWLIMGRKTYQSIGTPLPGRHTAVLTRNPELKRQIEGHPNACVAGSEEEALEVVRAAGEEKVFICGGESVYQYFLERGQRLYLSRVDFDGEADAFFPAFEHLSWVLAHSRDFSAVGESPAWSLEVWERGADLANSFSTSRAA